ncbi:Lrp/AsnC family transcriptional regulator [Aeromicrobium sp. UC242_57]|uniref:Lrp/AsnC family transcriptional regulator n=1 Tax=Aeromicrobium sp. UC242_57 TaxID=3374624 RepID=UPI0037A9E2EE
MSDRKPSTVRGQNLDDTAKRIIELLQDDGRLSYSAIAKEVNLSEAAVRHRVQKLHRRRRHAGRRGHRSDADGFCPSGHDRHQGQRQRPRGRSAAAAIEALDYIVVTTGRFDILAELVAESDDGLLDIVSEQISSLEGVVTTETFVYLRLEKQTYAWGVR